MKVVLSVYLILDYTEAFLLFFDQANIAGCILQFYRDHLAYIYKLWIITNEITQ